MAMRVRAGIPAVVILALAIAASGALAQMENVPAQHPVYPFLKRMEVRGLIGRYHDAVLPLSRHEVSAFLDSIGAHRPALTASEQGWLRDFEAEFAFDRTGSRDAVQSWIAPAEGDPDAGLARFGSDREKYLYATSDSGMSLFVNGLFTADVRRISGDALGAARAEYAEMGVRVRGTAVSHLGFEVQFTNAQFWGSRDLLLRDPVIGQSHALAAATDAQNFDFAEGYIRYDAGLVSAQVGRERLLWGAGYDTKMLVSDNIRTFDFLRFDLAYKAVRYTFLHGWLLGAQRTLLFSLPSDTTAVFVEPVAADKYMAVHRVEISFPGVIDFGAQEMAIYSNRAPDLAYLNPLMLFESAQRSRGERDNVLWAFDAQLHLIPGVELQGSFILDDIHLPDFFTSKWYNRYAYQGGVMVVDPFGVPNTTIMGEYARVEPYVYAHNRSRDNSFTSGGAVIGPRIGPNADSWFLGAEWLPARNLRVTGGVTWERKGLNVLGPDGRLVRNVGGDVLQPHRDSDPETKRFLDGTRLSRRRIVAVLTYEPVNQVWCDFRLVHDTEERASAFTGDPGATSRNTQAGITVRTAF